MSQSHARHPADEDSASFVPVRRSKNENTERVKQARDGDESAAVPRKSKAEKAPPAPRKSSSASKRESSSSASKRESSSSASKRESSSSASKRESSAAAAAEQEAAASEPVTKRRRRDELEGIDKANIVEGKRRRKQATCFVSEFMLEEIREAMMYEVCANKELFDLEEAELKDMVGPLEARIARQQARISSLTAELMETPDQAELKAALKQEDKKLAALRAELDDVQNVLAAKYDENFDDDEEESTSVDEAGGQGNNEEEDDDAIDSDEDEDDGERSYQPPEEDAEEEDDDDDEEESEDDFSESGSEDVEYITQISRR